MNILGKISIFIMSIFYINVGIQHFIDPDWFLFIIPPYIKFVGLELVYISGFFEVLFGILLVIPKYRRLAAYGIILLLIAVYPANIYLALNELPQQELGINPFKASWIRLPLQFVLIGIAYLQTKIN